MSIFTNMFGVAYNATKLEAANAIQPIEDVQNVASPWADNSHLEQITLQSLYGLSADDIPVNRNTAMSIAAISKGRNVICSSIARMPLVAYKNGVALSLQPAMLTQLQDGTPNFITVSWMVDHLIFFGRTFLLVEERDATGKPSKFLFVPEWELESDNGMLIKAFGKNVAKGSYIRIDANHSGILKDGREVLREVREIERAATEAGSNPVPSLIIKQKEGSDLSEAEVTSLLSRWTANRRKRYGSVAFANKAIDVEAIGVSTENLLIDARNYSAIQVARILGLPSYALDATVNGTSLNYSNQSSRNRELLDSLSPYVETIEAHLSMYLPYGTEVKFDTTELLLESPKERYETYKIALDAKFLTVDEVRAKENLEPLPEAVEVAPVVEVPVVNVQDEETGVQDS